MGTYSRSPAPPRLPGAYSITTYSRREEPSPPRTCRSTISTNRPMPCWSWTTGSPALSASGSTWLRRLECRALGRVVAPSRLPVRSVSETTTRAPSPAPASVESANPPCRTASYTDTTPGPGSDPARAAAAGTSASDRRSSTRATVPWPGTTTAARPPPATSARSRENMASISESLPRGAGGSPAATVTTAPSSGSVRKPGGTSCHHDRPASVASERTAENVR
jgi:hypothetical protein